MGAWLSSALQGGHILLLGVLFQVQCEELNGLGPVPTGQINQSGHGAVCSWENSPEVKIM